jgi:hypothetical protein
VEIEPVLKRAIDAHENVDVRFGVEFREFRQDVDGVTAIVHDGTREADYEIRCKYLIGCDGGGSRVREGAGIALSGESRIMPRFMTHFRSNARALLQRWGIAWHYQSAFATLIAQNDRDIWTLQSRFPAGHVEETIDPDVLLKKFVGENFEREILVANPWTPHLLVADAYRHERVLIAGDAAHQYIPSGGYGMNTGIADAFDLAWKLAATLLGFGGPELLASYEEERRPIALRNCEGSGRHNDVRAAIARLYEPTIGAEGPAGDAARARARAGIVALGNAENESRGLEYGYSYGDSSIVWSEPGIAAPDDPVEYAPTTVPGVRLPSVFLADGTAVFDRLGPWFTLLAFDDADATAVLTVAERRNVPLALLRIRERELAPVYEAPAVLVRPDQHVAWRGTLPRDERTAARIIDRVLGWDVR